MTQTMMKPETREILSRFCEKAEQIGAGRYFTGLMQGEGVMFGFRSNQHTNQFIDMEFVGPDEEDLRALLLTVRMFCIKRDCISPESIEALAANDPALSEGWRQHLVATRVAVDQMMQEPAGYGQAALDPNLTRGDVFDTFLYGEYAHMNEGKRELYQKWKQSPCFPLLQFTFSSTVGAFVCEILGLSEASRQELGMPN